MAKKPLKSPQLKDQDEIKQATKFSAWSEKIVFKFAFLSTKLFHLNTAVAVATLSVAIAVFLTNFQAVSIFNLPMQFDHTNDSSVKHGEKYTHGNPDAGGPSQISNGAFVSEAGNTKMDTKDSLHINKPSSPQRNGNFKHLSCSDKQKGSCGNVDKRQKLSLRDFLDNYDAKWPVIVTDAMSTWPAMNWTSTYFKDKYGASRVTMTTYSNSEQAGFSVPLKRFLDHLHMSSPNMWTYLQDELFLIQHPELREDVLKPIYTEEDMFQLLPTAVRPWDCMLLWGTAHSRSSLHIDPYNWTGTNAVISGLKRWKLLPPGQDKLLSVRPGRRCGFPLECVKYNSDLDLFEPSQQARLSKIRYLEADQGPGEMLFIPPGWFHQAYNVIPTLAVSGQMMNSNNYKIILEEMFKGGSIKRSYMPDNFDTMAPKDAVQAISAQIPLHILEEGMRRTEQAIRQLHMRQP